MVEGPLLHRLAFVHRNLLFGHRFVATSPTGRFADGAAAIDGLVLSHIEVHGKNIFYFFTPEKVEEGGVLEKVGDDAVVVHIHLGMSGSFRTYKFPGPVPREATRLRLYNEELGVELHLSSSVCDHGNIQLYRQKIKELGPDPLRKDADKELLWASMQKTKKSIGAVLMDQTLVAGIGNIYRAEILFVVGLHPDLPANTVSREAFEFLWEQSVRQMEIGVEVGDIITVLPEDAGKPIRQLRPSQLRYVYNQKACGKCGGVINVWTMAQRTVYACQACQPPPLSIPTVSKRVSKKAKGDDADSNSDEDPVISEKPHSTRKRVAKGGKVAVHKAYKTPKEVPETNEVKEFHDRFGEDGRTLEEFGETKHEKGEDEDPVISENPHSPRKRVAKGGKAAVHKAYKTPKEVPETVEVKEFHDRFGEDGRTLEEFGETKQVDGKASIQYTRRRGRAGNNINNNIQSEQAINPSERRSARLKAQAFDPSSTTLVFRGKSSSSFVGYGRPGCSMKFCTGPFPVRRFTLPLRTAFGLGALLFRGSRAGVFR